LEKNDQENKQKIAELDAKSSETETNLVSLNAEKKLKIKSLY
jgi:hypothetical protein